MYQEDQKKRARNEALEFAIKSLTKNRTKASIARRSYVRDIKNYLLNNGSKSDKEIASQLSDEEVASWEAFYDSVIGRKKPSQLRVAYLSGPNPENDISVFVKNGILPENIWAFESDNKLYDKAVISALASQFPFIKLYKGKVERYLKILPFKFDIIYLDFCSTIASTKTLSVIKDVFRLQKLNSLGVLITNFSLPDNEHEKNKEYRGNLSLLAANYLYAKPYTEEFTGLGGGFRDSALVSDIEPDEFVRISKRNLRTFYSQLITRLLFDIPSVIVPYQRLASDSATHNVFFKNFFKNFDETSFKRDFFEDPTGFPDDHSIVLGLTNYICNSSSFDAFFQKFKNQLSFNPSVNNLAGIIALVAYFKGERIGEDIHSEKLEKIRKGWRIREKHTFCDLFMFHQLKDVLIGQLTNPYYYNIDFTKRWSYKAKSAEMFMDVVTFDECRYIFDWMPTIDMFEAGVNDLGRQLSLRFAMDSLSKQNRWYNEEFFSGTAVVDQGIKSFEAKELKKRKVLK